MNKTDDLTAKKSTRAYSGHRELDHPENAGVETRPLPESLIEPHAVDTPAPVDKPENKCPYCKFQYQSASQVETCVRQHKKKIEVIGCGPIRPLSANIGGHEIQPVVDLSPSFADLHQNQTLVPEERRGALAWLRSVFNDEPVTSDAVDHPTHYNQHPSGVECIEIAQHMNFNLGNVLKYIWRCDKKGPAIEDLKKARNYLTFEIERREKAEFQ